METVIIDLEWFREQELKYPVPGPAPGIKASVSSANQRSLPNFGNRQLIQQQNLTLGQYGCDGYRNHRFGMDRRTGTGFSCTWSRAMHQK
jgi:hypothetical protein